MRRCATGRLYSTSIQQTNATRPLEAELPKPRVFLLLKQIAAVLDHGVHSKATSRAHCALFSVSSSAPFRRKSHGDDGGAQECTYGNCVQRFGMGKSYLCNCLLFGSPYAERGFRSEPSGDPITSECQAKTMDGVEPSDFALQTSIDILKPGGPLTMIDTPGIPDPAKRTLKSYDEIVRTARDAGRLNVFIMMVKDGGDRKHLQDDLETYHIMLK